MPASYHPNEAYERRLTMRKKNIMLKLADIIAREHLITPDEKIILQELIEKDEEL